MTMNEEVLERILTELTTIKSNMANKQDLQRVEDKVQELDQRLQTVEPKLDNMSKDLNDLKDEQQQIKQAVVEIDDIVRRIEVRQEQHELTLDLLSRRSIDQEAELRRIK